MALIIPPGFGQLSFEIRNVGDPEPWYITCGVDLTDVGGDYAAAGETAVEAFQNTWQTRLATDSRFSQVDLVVGQDGPDNLRYTFPVTNGQGAVNEAMLPQNCAALVDKVSNLAGRRGRGRMFIPNILVEGQVDSVGQVIPAFRNTLQTVADSFIDHLLFPAGDAPTPMVILHATGISTPPPPTPVEALVVQGLISTQRRRLR